MTKLSFLSIFNHRMFFFNADLSCIWNLNGQQNLFWLQNGLPITREELVIHFKNTFLPFKYQTEIFTEFIKHTQKV